MRWTMTLISCCLIACGLLASGCSRTTFTSVGSKIGSAVGKSEPSMAKEERMAREQHEPVALRDEAQPADPNGVNPPKAKLQQPRKIKYTADLTIIVADFSKAEAELDEAIKEAEGEKAKVEVNTSSEFGPQRLLAHPRSGRAVA